MADLTSAEIGFEAEMARLGRERYIASVARAQAHGREADTQAGRWLLRQTVSRTARAVERWLDKMKDGAGFHAYAVEPIEDCRPDVSALICCKTLVDEVSRPRRLTTVALKVGRRIEDELLHRQFKKQHGKLWDKVRKQTVRSGYDHAARVIRASLKSIGDPPERWPANKALRVGMVLVHMAIQETGLIEEFNKKLTLTRDEQWIQATDETREWLERSHERHELLYPFWMPTVDPPLPWVGLYGGGYHTDFIVRRPLVKFQVRRHKDELGEEDWTGVAEGVSFLQEAEWEVNDVTFQTLQHAWENGLRFGEMPPREDEPIPEKPIDVATNELSRKSWRAMAARVHQKNVEDRGKRISVQRILLIAERYQSRGFFFPKKCDWRGRVYDVPIYMNPQGQSMARSMLRFRRGKPLDDEGVRWLMIHGANSFGIGGTYPERIQAIANMEREIRMVDQDPLANRFWTEAKDPWAFLAFCDEFGSLLELGQQRFVSRLPVHMDATQNGLQIFSLLMRDTELASLTNVIPTGKPADLYQACADLATSHIQGDASELAKSVMMLLGGNPLPRECAKRPVMILPYGAKQWSGAQHVRDWLEGFRPELHPWHDCFDASRMIASYLWSAIEDKCGAALRCMDWLQECAQIMAKENQAMVWKTPSGFTVKQEYLGTRVSKIKTTIGTVIRWSSLMEPAKRMNRREQVAGTSPNFVHSLDAAVVHLTARLARRKYGIESMTTVHDSFGCLAADAGKMANAVREVYAHVFEQDQLASFRRQIAERHPKGEKALPPLPERGELNPRELLQSPYMLS